MGAVAIVVTLLLLAVLSQVVVPAAPAEAFIPVFADVAGVLPNLPRVRLEVGVPLQHLAEVARHREPPRPQHRLGWHSYARAAEAAQRLPSVHQVLGDVLRR